MCLCLLFSPLCLSCRAVGVARSLVPVSFYCEIGLLIRCESQFGIHSFGHNLKCFPNFWSIWCRHKYALASRSERRFLNVFNVCYELRCLRAICFRIATFSLWEKYNNTPIEHIWLLHCFDVNSVHVCGWVYGCSSVVLCACPCGNVDCLDFAQTLLRCDTKKPSIHRYVRQTTESKYVSEHPNICQLCYLMLCCCFCCYVSSAATPCSTVRLLFQLSRSFLENSILSRQSQVSTRNQLRI